MMKSNDFGPMPPVFQIMQQSGKGLPGVNRIEEQPFGPREQTHGGEHFSRGHAVSVAAVGAVHIDVLGANDAVFVEQGERGRGFRERCLDGLVAWLQHGVRSDEPRRLPHGGKARGQTRVRPRTPVRDDDAIERHAECRRLLPNLEGTRRVANTAERR